MPEHAAPAPSAYGPEFMTLAREADAIGPIARPDRSAEARSRICGSRVRVDLILHGNRVRHYGHRINACQIGRASAGLLARIVMGQDVASCRNALQALDALLTGASADWPPGWETMNALAPVAGLPSRHAAARLPLLAVIAALDGQDHIIIAR